MTRRYFGVRRDAHPKHYAFAQVSATEHAVLKAIATKEGLSISNFVRRCVNGYLLELGDDVPLLEESESRRGRPRKAARVA